MLLEHWITSHCSLTCISWLLKKKEEERAIDDLCCKEYVLHKEKIFYEMWITKVGIEKKEIHLLISWAVWQYLQIYSPHLVTSTRGSNDKCESAHLCSSHCIAAPQLAVMWRRLSDKLINPFYFSFSWADFLALNVWEWKDSSILFKVTDCCCKDKKILASFNLFLYIIYAYSSR